MLTFTYDTPRPRPNFPTTPDTENVPLKLPQPLPEEEPGEWGDPITIGVDDEERPARDDPPEITPLDEDGSGVALDEDDVPPARGPETESP